MTRRIAIIGSGVSGSTSALIMAGAGNCVTLIEKDRNIAPLVRGFNFDSIRVEAGFHYAGELDEGGAFTRLLIHTGLWPRLKVKVLDPRGFDTVSGPGMEPFSFPTGFGELRRKLKERFPRDTKAVDAYLDGVEKVSSSFPYLNPRIGWRQAKELSPFGTFDEMSLTDFIRAHSDNDELLRLLSAHTALHGVDAKEVPFTAHAAIMGGYYRMAGNFEGGGRALANAIEEELHARGVELLTGATATGIRLTPGGEVSGVKLGDGRVVECDTVICSTHPAKMLALTDGAPFRPAYRKRLAALKDSQSALMVFAKSDKPEPSLDRSNHFILPPPPSDPKNVGGTGKIIYVTAARLKDGSGSLGGFVALTPASFAPYAKWSDTRRGNRPEEYETYKSEALRGLLSSLEKSYPDMIGKAGRVGGATPLTFSNYTGSETGALYGVMRRVGQVNPTPKTRVKGLYLTGQAVALPGIMGAMTGGFLTCGQILGHEKLLDELGKIF